MEHRIGRRRSRSELIELWQGNLKRGDFELTNIGIGGLYLRYKKEAVDEGETFTIKFVANNQAAKSDYDLKVMVVHHSKYGAGLMWIGGHESFFSTLSSTLNRVA